MMSMFATEERKEKAWRDIIEGAGLRINKIWEYEKGTESLIECELPTSTA